MQLKGRWVEVDRERLTQALEHWQRVEAEAARGGLSFAEGMRLLAGAPRELGADAEAPETRAAVVGGGRRKVAGRGAG